MRLKVRGFCMSVLFVAALLCGADRCDAQGVGSMPVYSRAINPSVPDKVSVCGRSVDLDIADYAERYDRELTSLIYTHGNTLLTIKRANKYFPQIEPILKKNGIHSDLLYLACVESTLNPRALSPAKAAGIWQFIPSTAKEYGLEVNDEVDERYNIDKSTEAACRFFKKALAKFGHDWMAVFEAYNGGMTRVASQLESQLTDDALELYLAEETQRYPFRIMAMKTIMENPAAFGYQLTADQLYQPRSVDIIEVSTPVESWAEWARKHGVSYRDLREENPWIRAPKLTNKSGKTYKVRVPRKESLKRSTRGALKVYDSKWVKQ